MSKKLSIIIPCYNSATTLSEAVLSCYEQGLNESDFEIIIVNDASTDETKDEMEKLSHKYGNISLAFHEKNLGGGASRNTGIRLAAGEIIFCLDSDNFFAQQSVGTMLDYLQQSNLDGVAFHERRFFIGNNINKYSTHINPISDQAIDISDIFSINNHVLLDNFFFTKEAYYKTAGYPEHHGFDTQCFELRFLAAGNKVQICPNSVFYHRQDKKHNSYFQRVYKSGMFSLNYYLIAEDIIHLLSDKTLELIINFDIFTNSELNIQSLKAKLDQANEADTLLEHNYQDYLKADGANDWLNKNSDSTDKFNLFRLAVIYSLNQDYEKSLTIYTKLLKQGVDSRLLYFNLLRTEIALTNKYSTREKEKRALEIIKELTPQQHALGVKQKLIKKFTEIFS